LKEDIIMEKRRLTVIVPHTHWDRAWYVPFQEYRVRLVRLIDRLIDLLETNPDYSFFMLDGQASILEDYLEVRPQREKQLQALVKAKRISVGPWYVLPDEFLVSPEAIIRNLMLARRLCEPYGGVMGAGYVPDGFGHIGQLPQIFRGFGIDSAFFWRGVGAEADELGMEFTWVAPDGSQVTAIWMPWGYHNLSNVGYPIRWGDTSQLRFDWELAMSQIKEVLDNLDTMANTEARLLMNGIDHAEAEPRIPELIARANEAFPGNTFVQGTLLDYLEQVRASGVALAEFQGEFRWGRYAEVLQGVYSSRLYIKQRNHKVETLLERYAEPLTAFAWLACAAPPEGTQDVLATAWRWLLKNHPHDDIYGSGIDQVHDEMHFRFDQAEQIGAVLVRDNLRYIARQADFTAQPGTPVMVFNPLNWPRRETATGAIDFEFDDPTADDFVLVDANGDVIPHQVLSAEEVVWFETLKPNRKRRVRVAFTVDAPACGYTTVYAQPSGGRLPPAANWVIDQDGAENRYLSFSIDVDGGLTVVDKITGAVYRNLHHFYDVDDAGDEYSSCPCPNSEVLSTLGAPAEIERLAVGPAAVQFRVKRTFRVPASLTEDRQRRRRALAPLSIASTLTLYRDRPGLYIETRVTNTAKDHKLTVVFPTDLTPDSAHVDAAFQVSARDIDLPPADGWIEDPTPLMHQRAFTDLSDGRRGLAVLNRGLPSVEVERTQTDAGPGTRIALTLLRSVGWLSRDDLSNRRIAAGPLLPAPGAQCLGEHVFEYAIVPHPGDWREVYRTASNYTAPLHIARADTHEGMELREMPFIGVDLDWYNQVAKPMPWPRDGNLPDTLSFITLTPDILILSAVRCSEDGEGLVVRWYNPGSEPVTAELKSWRPLKSAYRLNLNQDRQEEIPLTDPHTVRISTLKGQIVTCELHPNLA
jgi:alpha-mannosidase